MAKKFNFIWCLEGLHACCRAFARVAWLTLGHKRKTLGSSKKWTQYGGVFELQRQLKMERTAQSGTTTGVKMAVNRSRTFHFMLPAVYGACMENVTCKAAGKLSKETTWDSQSNTRGEEVLDGHIESFIFASSYFKLRSKPVILSDYSEILIVLYTVLRDIQILYSAKEPSLL